MTNYTQASQQVPSELPELPRAAKILRHKWMDKPDEYFFTADQMREYARSAVLAAATQPPKACRQELIASGAEYLPKSCPRCGLSPVCRASVSEQKGEQENG